MKPEPVGHSFVEMLHNYSVISDEIPFIFLDTRDFYFFEGTK